MVALQPAASEPTPYPLPADHPGVDDPAYRRRRAHIADVGKAYRSGDPIPDVTYSPEEDQVWATVSRELATLHREHAAAEYLLGAERLRLPADRVPQLREVDARTRALTGFAVHPVPGLVPTDVFYGSLADRTFLATQYIRHHSVPEYTPEPDIVHEIIGHANMLGSPLLADLYQAAGHAARRVQTPAALELFSKVFWFTIEFGVVEERGALRTYGAGILSSFGELANYRQARIEPWDLAAMGTHPYDITRYQPVLYLAPSIPEMVDRLGSFFESFDDDVAEALAHAPTAHVQEQS